MNKVYLILLVGLCGVLCYSCSDDNFSVPPASTVPKFSYTIDNEELAPATVTFSNESIVPKEAGEATYYWNFGDGTSSEDLNPSHLFEEAGAFNVNLVVTTSASLEIKEVTKTIVIKDPNATGRPIYFIDAVTVYAGLINSQAPIFTPLDGPSAQSSYGMALDTINQQLYISDYGANKIYRCDPDGANFIDFRTGVDSPNGLAIDYEQNQIYWDTSNGIQRGDLDNDDVSQYEDFVTGQANDPDGISIDYKNRSLYWVNYNGGVWVKKLDGSGEQELLPDPEGGSMLVIADRIYYDEYVASGDIRLKSANLDGTGITTIASGITRVVYGLAYNPEEEKIYWVDRDLGTIMRANLDGSGVEAWYVNDAVSPRGLVIAPKL